jgi:hypothetical protein
MQKEKKYFTTKNTFLVKHYIHDSRIQLCDLLLVQDNKTIAQQRNSQWQPLDEQ